MTKRKCLKIHHPESVCMAERFVLFNNTRFRIGLAYHEYWCCECRKQRKIWFICQLHDDIRNAILRKIDAMPTAYDPDKVVKQLEGYSNIDEAERSGTIPVIKLEDAIKIVRGRGADEV